MGSAVNAGTFFAHLTFMKRRRAADSQITDGGVVAVAGTTADVGGGTRGICEEGAMRGGFEHACGI